MALLGRWGTRAALCLGLLLINPAMAQSPDDPFETLNRGTYYFNNSIDKLYLKPVVVAYDTVIPFPVKASIDNVYSNIGLVVVIINDALQLNIRNLFKDTLRLAVNSTLGLAGCFDVATPMGLKYHRTDLGQTLYVWGWNKSSYFMIPLIGPSTVRDAVGFFGEIWAWPPSYLRPQWRNPAYVFAWINRRYMARDLEPLIGAAGVENYELIRSGYLQNREFKLSGGQSTTATQNNKNMLGEPPD